MFSVWDMGLQSSLKIGLEAISVICVHFDEVIIATGLGVMAEKGRKF